MRSFKEVLQESGGNFIMSDEFIKNVDDWLFKNDQKNAQYLSKNKSKVPDMFRKPRGVLYRGMIVDQSFIDDVNEGKMKFDNITSWSTDRNVAVNFVTDKRFMTTKKSGIKIIITKKIPASKIILDIYNYALFVGDTKLNEMNFDSAMKEKEVLVDKGVNILQKDIQII